MSVGRSHHFQAWFCACGLSILVACGGTQPDQPDLDTLLGTDLSLAESRTIAVQVQEAVRSCMTAEGWEYTPMPVAQALPSEADDTRSSSYGERYGYGVIRRYELDELPLTSASGDFVDPNVQVDPNFVYRESLNPEQLAAYMESLYGVVAQGSGSGTLDVTADIGGGCYGSARSQFDAAGALGDEDVARRYAELKASIDVDPVLEDASRKWAACVATTDPSLVFSTPNDAEIYVANELLRAKGLRDVAADPETLLPIDPAEPQEIFGSFIAPDGLTRVFVGEPRRVEGPELAKLQAQEVHIWTVDMECRDSSEYAEVLKSLEEEVAETLLDEFPSLG